ncbi:MAG: hypothetical protein QOG59_3033, partial [Solirubrobacteraceae bacterium]|nr:hypothetical protein [Solirubrobacteraceae bacterium]
MQAEPSAPRSDAELTVVCVLFNSADVIEDCLRSLPPETPVVLVDNASADDGVARAIRARPDAHIVRSPSNRGFGAGCNLGWRAAATPYVAFLNPDARVHGDALQGLVACACGEGAAMVGPRLLASDGSTRPCKVAPSVWLDVCGRLPAAARWAPSGWDGKLDASDPVYRHGGRVSAVEGACFVMARRDLEAIGGFDEDFFLYSEEESIAYRLRAIGGRAIYEPRAVVEHVGETATAKVRPLAIFHHQRSRVVFYRKRDGALRGRLAGLALAIAVALSTPSAIVNELLGRKRRS